MPGVYLYLIIDWLRSEGSILVVYRYLAQPESRKTLRVVYIDSKIISTAVYGLIVVFLITRSLTDAGTAAPMRG